MAPAAANPWLAVRPLGDRLAQARGLQRLHEAFHAGKDVSSGLRAVVAQSWARSGRAGVDPVGHLAPIVMDDTEIEERWSRHRAPAHGASAHAVARHRGGGHGRGVSAP